MARKGFELLIDRGFALAKFFESTIDAQPDFEMIARPVTNILTYRYVPQNMRTALMDAASAGDKRALTELNEKLNVLTRAIQREQRRAGKSFVSRTTLPVERYAGMDCIVFRVVLANPLTTPDILRSILDEQRAIAQRLL